MRSIIPKGIRPAYPDEILAVAVRSNWWNFEWMVGWFRLASVP